MFLRVSRLIPLFLFFCRIVFFSLLTFMEILFDVPFSDYDNAYLTIAYSVCFGYDAGCVHGVQAFRWKKMLIQRL